VEKGNDQDAGEAGQPGQPTGGSQANQSGPTRERDPWAGTPELGETTLPDGTTLRRDADGKMWRGPDKDGHENVWDPESGKWMNPDTWTEARGADGWADPSTDWHDAWGGGEMPQGWQDVPRAGSTMIPEGTLSRDPSGDYQLNTPDGQSLKWNEQSGKWYDAASGRESATSLDPVDGWQRGAQSDAWARAHPDQPHPNRTHSGSEGPLRP